jgi:RHS repeat-associated protein
MAEVASASDYLVFGMQMPSRIITASTAYRYGFNGKEKDPDMDGNNYDYGFRIYNPQIGKFLSVDPLMKKYPELTPYQYASNKPVWKRDIDGLEAEDEKDAEPNNLDRPASYRLLSSYAPNESSSYRNRSMFISPSAYNTGSPVRTQLQYMNQQKLEVVKVL